MGNEREIRTEKDFWGNDREVVYEDGQRVGEIKSEERGGLFGIGGETVRVEYDRSGNETSYTKQEERGGIFGLGAETQEIRYDTEHNEIGHSRVEGRGGILGIGEHHVRVDYDNEHNELSQSNHERRGGILGIGGERVKVTRYSEQASNRTAHSAATTSGAHSSSFSSGTPTSSSNQSSANGGLGFIFLAAAIAGFYYLWHVAPWESPTSDRKGATSPGPAPRLKVTPPIDWVSPPKLTLKGFGPIRIGMTPAEISALVSGPLERAEMQDDACYMAKPLAAPQGIDLMFTDGRLARIDITSDAFATLSGARVGLSQEEVLNLYRRQLLVEIHKYDENWRYLTFIPKEQADSKFRVVFETDGEKVVRYRAGKLPEVEYVEGCL